jgi:uncharacterized membrane protein YqiK
MSPSSDTQEMLWLFLPWAVVVIVFAGLILWLDYKEKRQEKENALRRSVTEIRRRFRKEGEQKKQR